MIRRTRKSNIRRLSGRGFLFIMLLASAMPGCKKEEPAPPPKVSPLPKKPVNAQAVKPALPVQARVSSARKSPGGTPVQKQMSSAQRLSAPGSVNLDFTSKRDPFKPYVQQAPAQPGGTGKGSRPRIKDPLPIQRFDTEKFRVAGIITGLKENSALVIDPDKKGYVVKEGMPIGSNDGRVKRVTNSTVEVEEIFRDDGGKVRKRVIKLTLISTKSGKGSR